MLGKKSKYTDTIQSLGAYIREKWDWWFTEWRIIRYYKKKLFSFFLEREENYSDNDADEEMDESEEETNEESNFVIPSQPVRRQVYYSEHTNFVHIIMKKDWWRSRFSISE